MPIEATVALNRAFDQTRTHLSEWFSSSHKPKDLLVGVANSTGRELRNYLGIPMATAMR